MGRDDDLGHDNAAGLGGVVMAGRMGVFMQPGASAVGGGGLESWE